MKLWVAPAGLHIEPAMPADAETLAKLHAAAFYRGWPVEDFTNYINDPKNTPIYVACDKSRRIAGFMILRLAGDSADLLTITVDHWKRGKGLGAALLQAGVADLRMSPVTHIMLEVEEENHAAIRLYRTGGFKDVARREGYYPKPDGAAAAALVMRRDLN